MVDRGREIQDTMHQEIDLLLPWYVNGTLSAEDVSRVEAHLKECARCRQEERLLRALEAAIQEEPEPAASPGLFRETLARLPVQAGWWDRVAAWLAPPSRLRWAVAAAGAILLLQSALIAGLLSGFGKEKTYELLSVPQTQQAIGPRVLIAFQEEAQEQAIRRILENVRGQIVAGPSPLGYYTLELPLEEAGFIDQRIDQLRARKEVVRFVDRAP